MCWELTDKVLGKNGNLILHLCFFDMDMSVNNVHKAFRFCALILEIQVEEVYLNILIWVLVFMLKMYEENLYVLMISPKEMLNDKYSGYGIAVQQVSI